jgi:hypothetical protein
MAWATYDMTKARKLQPIGAICHYCAVVVRNSFPGLSTETVQDRDSMVCWYGVG